jgi:hypothetical protein
MKAWCERFKDMPTSPLKSAWDWYWQTCPEGAKCGVHSTEVWPDEDAARWQARDLVVEIWFEAGQLVCAAHDEGLIEGPSPLWSGLKGRRRGTDVRPERNWSAIVVPRLKEHCGKRFDALPKDGWIEARESVLALEILVELLRRSAETAAGAEGVQPADGTRSESNRASYLWRERGDGWEVQFQEEPDGGPARFSRSLGFKTVHHLLAHPNPEHWISALKLAEDYKAESEERRLRRAQADKTRKSAPEGRIEDPK